jgi:hypothetical protein
MEATYQRSSPENGITEWLAGWPPESVERLRIINRSHGSSRHILLSLGYGVYDKNIRKMNQVITGLLLARMRAHRSNQVRNIERLNALMEDIHVAVDVVTDTQTGRHSTPCNRPNKNSPSSRPVFDG